MSWVDKQIERVAPGWALRREAARGRMERLRKIREYQDKHWSGGRRTFSAVSGSRLRYDILSTSKSPDSAITADAEVLRQHVRQLRYDNGYVHGPVERIADHVVGLGFGYQSMVTADEQPYSDFPRIDEARAVLVNRQAEAAMAKWQEQAEKALRSSFGELCHLAECTLIGDGEVLAVGRTSGRRGRFVPYCIELYEIDRLQTPREELNNTKVRDGIRYDGEGVPEAYFVLKAHPGDTYITNLGRKGVDFEEIPAWNANGTRKVMHLFNPMRPEQSRGFSQLAAALRDLQDTERYREAEIYAALEDACLTGVVESDAANAMQQGQTSPSDSDDYDRIHDFAPGKWYYTRPGEKVTIHGPKRPNTGLDSMVNHLLRGAASGANIPLQIFNGDWADLNYSNARTILIMFYVTVRRRQRYLVEHLLRPCVDNAMTDFVVHGKVQAPGFDRRKDAYMAHGWIPPAMDWVDPVKEAQGKKIEMDENMTTLGDVCAQKGRDWEDVLERRARELQRMKELETKYGIVFPKADGAAVQAEPDADGNNAGAGDAGRARRRFSVVM